MAWVRFDDKVRSHPKFLQLRTAPEAKLLWFESMIACNEQTTDGFVHHYVVDQWAFAAGITTPKRVKAAAEKLVAVGLWHDHELVGDCEECKDVAGDLVPGSFYVHQYLDYQPSESEVKDPLEKRRARRRKQLTRNNDLCASIRARDHDRCRYCGDGVNFVARSGDQSGTYDHVNPNDFGSNIEGDKDGGNALHKVVVACRRCNGIKKNRTPDEAAMPLLDPPLNGRPDDVDANGESLAIRKESLAIHPPVPGRVPRVRPPARETGRGQDGPGTGQEKVGSGQDRARPARRGPGKAGGGPSRDGPGRATTGQVGRPAVPAPPITTTAPTEEKNR